MFWTLPTIMTWTRIVAIPLIVGVEKGEGRKVGLKNSCSPTAARRSTWAKTRLP